MVYLPHAWVPGHPPHLQGGLSQVTVFCKLTSPISAPPTLQAGLMGMTETRAGAVCPQAETLATSETAFQLYKFILDISEYSTSHQVYYILTMESMLSVMFELQATCVFNNYSLRYFNNQAES